MSMLSTSPGTLTRTLTQSGKRLWRPLVGDDPIPASRFDQAQGELVSLTCAVCLVLFLTKTLLAYIDLNNPDRLPRLWNDSLVLTLGRITACCAEDFAVGLGCLLTAGIALSLSSAF